MSSVFDEEVEGQHQQSTQLAAVLERVAELQAEKDRLAAEATKVGKALKEAEQLAVEVLAASGLKRVHVAGKSWGMKESFYVSIPVENREQVLEIARRECPEYIGVNTSQLKAYLKEHKADGSESLSEGTAFAGLLEEYREVRLSRLTIG